MSEDKAEETAAETAAKPEQAVRKGDRFWGMGADIEVKRVAASGGWADIKVRQPRGGQWTKRQPLPFPSDWERHEPTWEAGAAWEPMWTIHPGVTWRDVVKESELNQTQIAAQMGISEKHLSQILTCTVMPGVEATVSFARVMGVSPAMLWQLACDHRLALTLGKTDLTREYL